MQKTASSGRDRGIGASTVSMTSAVLLSGSSPRRSAAEHVGVLGLERREGRVVATGPEASRYHLISL